MQEHHDRLTGNKFLAAAIDEVDGFSESNRKILRSRGIKYIAQLASLSRNALLHYTESLRTVSQAGSILRSHDLALGDTQAYRGMLGFNEPANRHGALFLATTEERLRSNADGDASIRMAIDGFFRLKPLAEPVLSADSHNWFSWEHKKALKVLFRKAVLADQEFLTAYAQTSGTDIEGIRRALNRVIIRKLSPG